jgi:hypothetical protein
MSSMVPAGQGQHPDWTTGAPHADLQLTARKHSFISQLAGLGVQVINASAAPTTSDSKSQRIDSRPSGPRDDARMGKAYESSQRARNASGQRRWVT